MKGKSDLNKAIFKSIIYIADNADTEKDDITYEPWHWGRCELGAIADHIESEMQIQQDRITQLESERDELVNLVQNISEYVDCIPLHFDSKMSQHSKMHIQHFVSQIKAHVVRAEQKLKGE